MRQRDPIATVLRSVTGLLVGVAAVPGPDEGGPPLPQTGELPWALSLAMPLLDTVIDGLVDEPTRLYKHHYKQANARLDQLALDVALVLQSIGARALPLPASAIIDWTVARGHLDHRQVALAAGLGWIGRHGLLVTPEYGAQVRLVTILTDRRPSVAEELLCHREFGPGQEACARCRACLAACPVRAIAERAEDHDLQACSEVCADFSKRLVGVRICGLCLKPCRPGPASSYRWQRDSS